MPDATRRAEVVIAGGGLAGIAAASELLDRGCRVLVVDKDTRERFGGLAKESFGGVMIVGTPHQRRLRITDSPELAWSDWERVAKYGPGDRWPREWGRLYCERSLGDVYEFLDRRGVRFLPVVYWPERGLREPANSVPRWHIAWGTGHEIVDRAVAALEAHAGRDRLELMFDTEISGVEITNGRATGVVGRDLTTGRELRIVANAVVIASGGICGGDLKALRAHWDDAAGPAPTILLNGAHRYADGMLHERVAAVGGAITHLHRHWHYAAGVHRAGARRPHDGLSLVPPRSALWLNARGERIMNPGPMLAYSDTRHLVESVLRAPGQYSWQVMNWKIAIRELAVSGAEYMTAFRNKRKLSLATSIVFGNRGLVRRLVRDCPDDFVVCATLDELMDGMDRRSLDGLRIDRARVKAEIRAWDSGIDAGPPFADEQLRWIEQARLYRGDRLRTCRFQKILDRRAGPLIAIREFILVRKSLGGIQTDLQCRVLRSGDGEPIPGLYAVGEAAGFGGGGIHGRGSLEGTFLGACILTGRAAGRSIGR